MSDGNISLGGAPADDLPRTFRREREARERAARASSPPTMDRGGPMDRHSVDHDGPAHFAQWDTPTPPVPAIVRAIDVPFFRLVLFFLKAAVAAIPALILLTAIMFAGGQALKHYFPGLRHFEIEIRPVGSAFDAAPPQAATPRAPAAQRK